MKSVVLDQVTLCADGSIGIRWLKQIAEGGEIIFSEPHRTSVEFDGDAASQMEQAFAHLAGMGYDVPEEDRRAHCNRVVAIDRLARRDPAIAAARQAKTDARAAL